MDEKKTLWAVAPTQLQMQLPPSSPPSREPTTLIVILKAVCISLLVATTYLLRSTIDLPTALLPAYQQHEQQSSPPTPPSQLYDPLIPSRGWYISLPTRTPSHPGASLSSIIAANPSQSHRILNAEAVAALVRTHFAHVPAISAAYASVTAQPVLQAALTRLLLLYVEGGAFADSALGWLAPVEEWVPAEHRGRVRLVLGVGGGKHGHGASGPDRLHVEVAGGEVEGEGAEPKIMLLASSPGHELLDDALWNAVGDLEAEDAGYSSLLESASTDEEYERLRVSGPTSWNWEGLALQHLSLERGETIKKEDLSSLESPVIWGDTLLLPMGKS